IVSLQIGVSIGCIREAVSEWEERLLVLRLIPLVADLHTLVVLDRVFRLDVRAPIHSAAALSLVLCCQLRNDRMRQVGFALRKSHGQFASRVHLACEDISQSFMPRGACIPDLDYTAD